MAAKSKIMISRHLKNRLRSMKLHPRETYSDVIEHLLEDLEDSSPEAIARYQKILREAKAGDWVRLDDLEREWGT